MAAFWKEAITKKYLQGVLGERDKDWKRTLFSKDYTKVGGGKILGHV